jgi:anthranilate phosphoribosyltransferase
MAAIDAHGGWPAVLGTLLRGEDLEQDVAGAALTTVLAGDATAAQIAGFIVALRLKGESVPELAGMVDAMLRAATPLDLPADTIDIVGTGGSPRRRQRALNVSTMASIVAAAAGATVCKHGNVKASSTSGSFDLLGALGIGFDLEPARLAQVVRDVGVGFCFARAYHPAMRHAGPVRAELGVPTVFNVLGPLSHPGRVRRQVLGVGDPRLLDLVAGVLASRGADHALVVHGADHLDELSLTGPTHVREVRDGAVVDRYDVDPAALDLAVVAEDEMPGGTPEENRTIALALFDGAPGPARDIVTMNAAAALYVAGRAASLPEGVEVARRALDEGAARSTLDRLVAATTG